MKVRAVIFDLDGTLLDTLYDLKESVNAALGSRDMPLCTLEQVRMYVGNGIHRLMCRAVPGGEDNPDFGETFSYFKRHYREHCMDHTGPYPEVLELLAELKRRGIAAAIVSNKADFAVKELNRHFFSEYISVALGESPAYAPKPAPDMVEEAMRQLGVSVAGTVYVGDSDVDITTAKNAGLNCVSVTWGFRSREFLLEMGAETLIQSPKELLCLPGF